MRNSLRREGELVIDNTNSPGVPMSIIRATGLDVPFALPGKKLEVPFYMCAHCNGMVIKNPDRTRPREICFKCFAPVCDGCKALDTCTPFKKLILEG